MIWPMVEQAHLGTTRYTMLSLSVIHVPGKPMLVLPPAGADCFEQQFGLAVKKQRNAVYSISLHD
jgi:hypothetical protein